MRHLIVYAHPSLHSLNGFFKQVVEDSVKRKGDELEIRDLYKLNFNPILSAEDIAGQRQGKVKSDVRVEQEFIKWADCLTFIYPIWWTGFPAIMKGYIDRVFTYGFAYRYNEGVHESLLTDKQAIIINSHGKSHAEYHQSGMHKALLLTSDIGIYSYSGISVKRHIFFEKADSVSSQELLDWERQIRDIY
ncbi:NAD(P)H-dependent oxidoreductase [Penaeicola halotolerans]|uniref:NAD(P)H-dependent oxidoreductase n=1 Tax=Penaeicola halotolerans TaxID=2793196 RepID=UPI001CF8B3C8|nr:NAD(P)H-dependent oxidoreductase [Penaeicola halotolerans]